MLQSLGERLSARYRLINWFYSQFSPQRIVRTFLVLGFAFGMTPGAWLFGFPILLSYGIFSAILNRNSIKAWIKNPTKGILKFKIFQDIQREREILNEKLKKINKKKLVNTTLQGRQPNVLLAEQNEELKQRTAKRNKYYKEFYQARARIKNKFVKDFAKATVASLIENWPKLLKIFFTAYLLLSTTSIISLFSIYGLYRYSFKSWKKTALRYFNLIYQFSAGAQQEATRSLSFNKKLMLSGFLTLFTASLFYANGLFLLIDLFLSSLQLIMCLVGFKALIQDIGTCIRRPLQTFTKNPGKIYGVFWGRWLAYAIFPGKVVGSMGPAVGIVESQGIFSGILPGLFGSSNSWFIFQTGLTSLLTSRAFSAITSIASSVFFSHNMRIYGDFYGIIGPTSFQIYVGMAFGCFVGWCFERSMKHLFKHMLKDASLVINKSQPSAQTAFNFIYRSRWELGFTLGMTPLVLSSAGGATLIAFVGGNMLAAGALTAGIAAASIISIHTFAKLCKHIAKRMFGRVNNLAPMPQADYLLPVLNQGEDNQPAVDTAVAVEPVPTFTPQFTAEQVQQTIEEAAQIIASHDAPVQQPPIQDNGVQPLGLQG